MPSSQLDTVQNTLLGLRACFSFTKNDLEGGTLCPHCQYRPIDEGTPGLSPDVLLNNIDSEIDSMLKNLTAILFETVTDPDVAQNIELVSNQEGKEAVQNFIKTKVLPAAVGQELVATLLEIFSGLEKVKVIEDDLKIALEKDKAPCTVDELKSRFDGYVEKLTRGKNSDKVRIVFD